MSGALDFRDVEIDGRKYRATRMSGMDQLKVAKRIAPVFSGFGTALGTVPDLTEPMTAESLNDLFLVGDAVSRIKDEDLHVIIKTCLARVTREEAAGIFAPVWSDAADKPQYDDMNLIVIFKLVALTVRFNLSGFFPAPASPLSGAPPA